MYTPPFTISAEAINKIADISRLIERYAIRMEQEDALLLRKANKIKTIHSSLAIEGNTLNEDQVRDIVNGKTVVAPLREIQEVKNAIATYEQFPLLNAFKEKDLLRAHGIMMQALVDHAGHYRRGNVGVFSETGCVHVAPPADRVPSLMGDLFDWLSHSKDHLLVRSCVFHYEFEFIHPFADGNGRMGRLWQSLILTKLHPVFEHLPVENMVHDNQMEYYDAITASTNGADSGPFIDFMLGEILKTLELHKGDSIQNGILGNQKDIEVERKLEFVPFRKAPKTKGGYAGWQSDVSAFGVTVVKLFVWRGKDASVPEKLVPIVMDEAVNHLDALQRGTAAKIDEDGVAE